MEPELEPSPSFLDVKDAVANSGSSGRKQLFVEFLRVPREEWCHLRV